MVTKRSHLSLVKDDETSRTDVSEVAKRQTSFVVAAVSQLSSADQQKVSDIVHAVHPKAVLLGVQLTVIEGDLRPIVVIPGESGPSVIRLVESSPESPESLELRDTLERLSNSGSEIARSHLVEWGFIGTKLFYRREVIDKTFAAHIEEPGSQSLRETLVSAKRIAESLDDLHRSGVVHGHLTEHNIVIQKDNTISFTDTGYAAALLRAQKRQNRYQTGTIAPEAAAGGSFVRSSDVYSLGCLLKARLPGSGEERTQRRMVTKRPHAYSSLEDLIEAMTDENPARRPALQEVIYFFEQIIGEPAQEERPIPEVKHRRRVNPLAGPKVNTGRIVRIKKTNDEIEERIAALASQAEPRAEENKTPALSASSKPQVLSAVALQELGIRGGQQSLTKAPVSPTKEEAPRIQATPAVEQSTHAVNETPLPEPAIKSPSEPTEPLPAPLSSEGNEQAREELGSQTTERPRVPSAIEESKSSSSSSSLFWASLMTLIVLCCGVYYKQSQAEISYSSDELELAWFSKRPSLMIPVAERALDAEMPDSFAEMLIVSSIMNGQVETLGVNRKLLQIAFNSRWEQQLSPADRRVALALSLTALMRERTPTDLQAIDQTHPAVVLAITSTGGDRAVPFLNRIPAEILTSLPAPYGSAFKILTESNPELRCGDDSIRGLAKLAAFGWTTADEVLDYLGTDTATRIQATAMFFQNDEQRLTELLSVLIAHPNRELDSPLVAWGKTWKLGDWDELSSFGKLALLGGSLPGEAVRAHNVAKLFAHPEPAVRAHAITVAIDSIKFKHRAAVDILKYVAQDPKMLDPKQTMILAQILESPKAVSGRDVRSWIASQPPVEIAAYLLIGTADSSRASTLDFELARYLAAKPWKADSRALVVLARHPEQLVRIYAYNQAFKLEDKGAAQSLLSAALEREQVPMYREQIQMMLRNLS